MKNELTKYDWLLASMSSNETKKALRLFKSPEKFVENYIKSMELLDKEDFVSFEEYLEIEEHLQNELFIF